MSGLCFSLGPQTGLSFGQYITAKQGWYIFETVWGYNTNISTILAANPSAAVSYWRFENSAQLEQYRQGQQLHSIAYPASNWNSVGTG